MSDMFRGLFNNPGAKLKRLSEILFWVELIGSVLLGIIMVIVSPWMGLTALIVIICGPISAYVGSIALYAFGQLVEDVSNMRTNMNTGMCTNMRSGESREAPSVTFDDLPSL